MDKTTKFPVVILSLLLGVSVAITVMMGQLNIISIVVCFVIVSIVSLVSMAIFYGIYTIINDTIHKRIDGTTATGWIFIGCFIGSIVWTAILGQLTVSWIILAYFAVYTLADLAICLVVMLLWCMLKAISEAIDERLSEKKVRAKYIKV